MTPARAKLVLPGAAALALAACSSQDESDATYEAGVEDQSGGELVVSTPDPNAVPVTLPETPMTPAPDQTAGPTATVTTPVAIPSPAPAASPAPKAVD